MIPLHYTITFIEASAFCSICYVLIQIIKNVNYINHMQWPDLKPAEHPVRQRSPSASKHQIREILVEEGVHPSGSKDLDNLCQGAWKLHWKLVNYVNTIV